MTIENQAQTQGTVLILNRDLFFGVRLRDLLTSAGYDVTIVPNTAAFLERLRAAPDEIALGVIDMGAGVDWPAISELEKTTEQFPPLLVFGPHKAVDDFRAAKAAGVTRVVANSEFHRNTLGLVQRYARGAADTR